MSFVEFLMKYYIYILIVLVLMIITVIGFLADKRDKGKKKNKKDTNVASNENVSVNNTGVNGETLQPAGDIAPTPLQPQNLDASMNNNAGVNANSGLTNSTGVTNEINGQTISEQPLIREEVPSNQSTVITSNDNDVNSLGYKPLDEQKPKIAPKPVEIPADMINNNLGSGSVVSNVNPVPTPVDPTFNQTSVAPAVNQTPVMNQATVNVNPTSMNSQLYNGGQNASVVRPVPETQVQPNINSTSNVSSTQTAPVVNSWDVRPTPSVNPSMAATAAPTMSQPINQNPNVNNVNLAPVQPNINVTPTNGVNNVVNPVNQAIPTQQVQPQQPDSGMNFVYGHGAQANTGNQMNNNQINNQDLWKL